LSDLELHLLSSLPLSGIIATLRPDTAYAAQNAIQGLTNEKSHGTVVLAAFAENVDETVRTVKRFSIATSLLVVKGIRAKFFETQPALALAPILMYKRGGCRVQDCRSRRPTHQIGGGSHGEHNEATIGEFCLLQG
jgi:hypothetical protein